MVWSGFWCFLECSLVFLSVILCFGLVSECVKGVLALYLSVLRVFWPCI